MKKLLLLFLVIFTSSCDLDEWFEKPWEIDRDDVDIINKVWDQYLDKAIKLYDTSTHTS
jgi:hypothetical protein